MRFNPQLKSDFEKYKNHVILVEGQKDVNSLKSLGFEKIFAIHKNNVSIKERIEQIMQGIDKKSKICILTDFDKKGKKMYLLVKQILQENGANVDSGLRGLLLKSGVSHIEGLATFIKKIEKY